MLEAQVSVTDGAFVTAGASSVGTLGGGVLGTAAMTYPWLRQRGVSLGAAGLGGWIPIFLNEATLAIISLLGLLTLLLLNKFSGILDLGLGLAVLILATGLAALRWSLTDPAEDDRSPRHRSCMGRRLEARDSLLRAGWRGPVTCAALNAGFDMLMLAFLFLSAGHGRQPAGASGWLRRPQLLGKLTVILGGVGVVETTMVGLYRALGVSLT